MKTDPALLSVHYLPDNSPEREIRLIEVNELIGELNDSALEPLDFGVDVGSETAHKLLVMDVTPKQWNRIKQGKLHLPPGWSLERAVSYTRK